MSQTMIMILVVGAIIGAVIFRCKAEFLAPLCEAWPEGGSIIESVGGTVSTGGVVDSPDTPTIAPITLPPKKVAVKSTTPTTRALPSGVSTSAKGSVSSARPRVTGSARIGAGAGTCPPGQIRNRLTGQCNRPITGSNYTTSLFTTERVFI